ncbi:MAG: FAD-binding protein [Candidatus Pacebacteria bacterium]|nr:FAD-binding protein [Candidatus Paceibacterota bacterium]
MSILVVAEHDGKQIKAATLHAVTAATKLNAAVTLLLCGAGSGAVAESAAKIAGVAEVLVAEVADLDNGMAESMAPLLAHLAKGYSHIVVTATAFGKNILPRASALLDVQQISEVIEIKSADSFVRPIYAGNALATVKSNDKIKLLSIRMTAFEPAAVSGGSAAVKKLAAGDLGAVAQKLSQFKGASLSKSERPELTSAKIVVSGGRGMQNGENFKLLDALADKLGAAVGASRAAVDAGFVPNEYQVGQTGKVVAPELYVAVGISGAIQHLAGMKDSKVIVAINKDVDAPIFQVADYGLVADLFTAIPALTAAIKK